MRALLYGEADPGWLGPANLVSLVLATALLGGMLREAARRTARGGRA